MIVTKWVINTERLDKIAAHLGTGTDEILQTVAEEVEQTAKPMAPVDTGALRSSINTEKVDDKTYRVQDGVEYGIYQELGNHRMAAHPFLVPAIEKVRPTIANFFLRLFK